MERRGIESELTWIDEDIDAVIFTGEKKRPCLSISMFQITGSLGSCP
jgi:hypothetical protein